MPRLISIPCRLRASPGASWAVTSLESERGLTPSGELAIAPAKLPLEGHSPSPAAADGEVDDATLEILSFRSTGSSERNRSSSRRTRVRSSLFPSLRPPLRPRGRRGRITGIHSLPEATQAEHGCRLSHLILRLLQSSQERRATAGAGLWAGEDFAGSPRSGMTGGCGRTPPWVCMNSFEPPADGKKAFGLLVSFVLLLCFTYVRGAQ